MNNTNIDNSKSLEEINNLYDYKENHIDTLPEGKEQEENVKTAVDMAWDLLLKV